MGLFRKKRNEEAGVSDMAKEYKKMHPGFPGTDRELEAMMRMAAEGMLDQVEGETKDRPPAMVDEFAGRMARALRKGKKEGKTGESA